MQTFVPTIMKNIPQIIIAIPIAVSNLFEIFNNKSKGKNTPNYR